MQINYEGYVLNLCSRKLVKLNMFSPCMIYLFSNINQLILSILI